MKFRSALAAVCILGAASAAVVASAPPAGAVSPDVVISQVYGGGESTGATYANDYVELFNRGPAAVGLGGWSVQYASVNGSMWFPTTLSGTIPAGRHFLIRLAGGSSGSALPPPDASGTTSLAATGGKVALSTTSTPFSGLMPSGGQLRDFVGYGSATAFEGSGPAPAPSTTTADSRIAAGCTDTDDNRVDFAVTAPNPRNVSSSPRVCSDVVVSEIYSGGGNVGAPFANDYVELFNRSGAAIDLTGWSVQYSSASSTNWQVTSLTGVIPAHGYFLVTQSGGSNGGVLPQSDSSGTVNLAVSGGKVALVDSSTAIVGAGPTGSGVRDFVGYGGADAYEGTGPAPATENTIGDRRAGQGCIDTDDNTHDFRNAGPLPRNSATAPRLCGAEAGHTVSDYDGSGTTDVAVFRPSTGVWFVDAGPTTAWGTNGDVPVPGDYDGNGTTDMAVYRPSAGVWFVNGGATTAWGTSGDIPVPGDYDGDGTTDMAVFRPSTGVWFVNGGATTAWGTNGDIPVPGDYDGNGTTDIAVFRPSAGTWFVRNGVTVAWGTNGDIPVPGDYDGNGTADLAVFRPSTGVWFVQSSFTVPWGTGGDLPLPLPAAIRSALFS